MPLDVAEGSVHQEPGSGIQGKVDNLSLAIGTWDWVLRHMGPAERRHAERLGPPALPVPPPEREVLERGGKKTLASPRPTTEGCAQLFITVAGALAGQVRHRHLWTTEC